MKALFNDIVVEELMLPLNDRGLQYGDGLFETIIIKDGIGELLGKHLNRLIKGMQTLHMEVPSYFSVSYFEECIAKLGQINRTSTMVANVMVWRRPGGLYTPLEKQVNLLLKCRQYKEKDKKLKKIGICQSISNHYQPYSPYKSNSLKYVLAGIEKKESRMDDLIILDSNGHISETIDKNIYWQSNDIFYTPAIETGCIAGVMLDHLFETWNRDKKTVVTGFFEPEVLKQATKIFACNASGVYEVGEVLL
jgi:4-amino-4-deoxychorismate lyase